MKICVSTQDNSGIEEPVEQHFGKAPTYTVMDIEKKEIYVIQNESDHMG